MEGTIPFRFENMMEWYRMLPVSQEETGISCTLIESKKYVTTKGKKTVGTVGQFIHYGIDKGLIRSLDFLIRDVNLFPNGLFFVHVHPKSACFVFPRWKSPEDKPSLRGLFADHYSIPYNDRSKNVDFHTTRYIPKTSSLDDGFTEHTKYVFPDGIQLPDIIAADVTDVPDNFPPKAADTHGVHAFNLCTAYFRHVPRSGGGMTLRRRSSNSFVAYPKYRFDFKGARKSPSHHKWQQSPPSPAPQQYGNIDIVDSRLAHLIRQCRVSRVLSISVLHKPRKQWHTTLFIDSALDDVRQNTRSSAFVAFRLFTGDHGPDKSDIRGMLAETLQRHHE
jgi:hypothetical protein